MINTSLCTARRRKQPHDKLLLPSYLLLFPRAIIISFLVLIAQRVLRARARTRSSEGAEETTNQAAAVYTRGYEL